MIVNKFPAMAAALPKIIHQMVTKAALDVQALAVVNAPRDTGFLASSIYTVTSDSSTYGNAGTPPGDSYLLPQVDPPDSPYVAIVAVGANYGIFVEMGHHTRGGGFVAAQPYLFPATDQGQDALNIAMYQVEALLGAA